jgi:nitrogen regulatory protein PII
MYKVEALIRPDSLEDVKYGLLALGYDDFVVADAMGHGAQLGQTACYRGVKYELPFVHQLRVELSVPETALEAVIERIVNAAHTGQPGDGKIFVTSLAEVIEIGIDRPMATAMSHSDVRPRLAATADANWPGGW